MSLGTVRGKPEGPVSGVGLCISVGPIGVKDSSLLGRF